MGHRPRCAVLHGLLAVTTRKAVAAQPVEIPSRLKISHQNWRVEIVDTLTFNGAQALGRTDAEVTLISILEGQSESQLKDTLLHEVLHAIISNTILWSTKKNITDEEGVIRSVTPYLLGVLQDNPQLVRYLISEEAA